MNQRRYIYNETVDKEATSMANTLCRSDSLQKQDEYSYDVAYQVAIRVAHIEARCWEKTGPRKIIDNDGNKIREMRKRKLTQHFEEADEATTGDYHQTYQSGDWTRCRHCPARCRSKNAHKFFVDRPCYRAVMRKLTTSEPTGWHAVNAEYRMQCETEGFQIYDENEDKESNEKTDGDEASQQQHQKELLVCQACGLNEDETFVYKCEDKCLAFVCIQCEAHRQCGRCSKEMCEPCYQHHYCTKEPENAKKVTSDPNSTDKQEEEDSSKGTDNIDKTNVGAFICSDKRISNFSSHNSQSTIEVSQQELNEQQGPSRKRARLDDSDISDLEEQCEPDGDVLHAHLGPPHEAKTKEADSSASTSGYPCYRLRTKTKASEAHPKYAKYERAKKNKIDYKAVSKDTDITKKNLQSKLDMRSAILSSAHVSAHIKLAYLPGCGALDRVHESHRRMMTNQIVVCRHCGLYALNKAEGLAKPCLGRPANNFGRCQLRKLLEGRNPIRGAVAWPDGSHIRVQFKPVRLDIY